MSITAVTNARVYGLATAVLVLLIGQFGCQGPAGPAWTNGTRTFRFRWATICLGLHAGFLADGGEQYQSRSLCIQRKHSDCERSRTYPRQEWHQPGWSYYSRLEFSCYLSGPNRQCNSAGGGGEYSNRQMGFSAG
jgi:hypothetical protein